MKPSIRNLVLSAILGGTLHLPAANTFLPNGDFETSGGAPWAEVNAEGSFFYDYPDSGGNPGGYGVIDNTGGGGWGIWVSNDEVPVTLASLGLTAGQAYKFTQDMKILSGSSLGGFKVDYFSGSDGAGSSGEIWPALVGDGSTWETYSFQISIPAAADGIKVVPLWGPGSSIGYDNICVDPTPIPLPPVPNGDFENGSASWFENGTAGETTWSYPSTGGNPGGYGIMDNSGAGYALWVANGGAPLALESLGLAGGDTVTFVQDMTLLSGSTIGGLKIEFLEGATFLRSTGDMNPELIGDGSTWETYSFEVTIPANADHIKIVPLWGAGSEVGYDNVGFIKPAPRIFAAAIRTGTLVSWTANSADSTYQPQKSADNNVWTNLGPAIVGNAVSSVFDADGAAFYRVEESELVPLYSVVNSGFENHDAQDPPHADSWDCIGSQPPTLNTEDAHTDSTSMRIAVANAASEANVSEIQQNIANVGSGIVPGATYEFSFWAKQISNGVSYVQQYRVQWLNDEGAILGGGVGFNDFLGGDGVWKEITASGLVAPLDAATALIQIIGVTGGVAGGLGEVLIDDVELITTIDSPIGTRAATTAAGAEVSWDSEPGRTYQVRTSDTLESFADFGPAIPGDGERQSVTDLLAPAGRFYSVEETR